MSVSGNHTQRHLRTFIAKSDSLQELRTIYIWKDLFFYFACGVCICYCVCVMFVCVCVCVCVVVVVCGVCVRVLIQ